MTDFSKILIFQHVPFEGPGCITNWAGQNGLEYDILRLFEGQAPPAPGEHSLLVVMGGPMGAYEHDKYGWLEDEKRAIERFIEADIPVLGICLGAQLVANVLGARISPSENKEIGWFPVSRVNSGDDSITDLLPVQFDAFHWHSDKFDIPAGAVHLAESEGCKNQAFLYSEKVAGLQFHLEITPPGLNRLIENCGDDLAEGKYIQRPEEMRKQHQNFYKANGLMNTFLDSLTI